MPRPKVSDRRKITVTDVARECRVSRATVSLVLRGSPLVNIDTRVRIEHELKRMGYVYNRSAANLRRRISSSVALVINDLSNPFFAEFAAGVDEALAAAGYVTLLGSTSESPERQQAVLASLMEHGPAGLILSPAEGSDSARVAQLLGMHIPVLVFNRELPQVDWDFLVLDNRTGARLATEHLLALGHRRIAFFGGHLRSSSCYQRRLGYHDALDAAGVVASPQWQIQCAPTRLEAAAQTGALFAAEPAPTAAVCYNDAVALGLMHGLTACGRRPGHDFSVTGFDDIPEAAVTSPPLTTIAAEPRLRGAQAAQLILDRTLDRERPPWRVIAMVQLVVRGSTCAPPIGSGT
jgi:LacI family transcriptional regulator